MANSVMSKPSLQPRKGRNGFDLSFHRNYTAPLGAMLPVFHDIALPGDKYRLNTATFVRTEPLEKAAFARFKLHVDWFFVPMTQMYSRWNEFYNQTNDVMSSLFSSAQGSSNTYSWPLMSPLPYLGKFHEQSISGFSVFTPGLSGSPSSVSYYSDVFGVPYVWNFRRLWDMFGYGSLSRRFSVFTDTESYLMIPYLAYHKVWHSHYRPTQWFKNDPSYYNVDRYYASGSVPEAVMQNICCTVHYRPYRKDYFTNIMPSPLYNSNYPDYIADFGVSDVSGSSAFRNFLNPENSFDFGSFSNNGLLQLVSGSSANSSLYLRFPNSQCSLSSSDIRTVFAFDKLLRVTAFAGSHYQDQVLAHYGIKIPEGISDEAYFLGSQSVPVVVNEVVATASTGATEDGKALSGSTLGDLAGKAFTPSDQKIGKDISFTCPCDGVIIGIQSIELLPDYSSMFLDRKLRYQTTWDFYHPELDGIGMQPMVVNQLGFDPENSNSILGWQYRYSELKTNVDVTNEGFWDTNRYNWSPTKQSSILGYGAETSNSKVTYSTEFNFLCFPQAANSIFLKKYPFYDSTGSGALTEKIEGGIAPYYIGASSSQSCYENDPFLVSMDIKAFKTSIMSTFSLDKVL